MVAHTRLQSVEFWSWSQFLAVSLQVTWIINPAVGCHYFPPGLQFPPQPLKGLLPICCLVNRRTVGVNSLPKTVTRQRRDCDLNLGPSAPESSTLTTRLPSHPGTYYCLQRCLWRICQYEQNHLQFMCSWLLVMLSERIIFAWCGI